MQTIILIWQVGILLEASQAEPNPDPGPFFKFLHFEEAQQLQHDQRNFYNIFSKESVTPRS